MSIQQGIFSAKLLELEKQYKKFQARLATCQQMDHDTVREEIRDMEREWQESEYMLRQSIIGCRSRAVGELADIQLDYLKRADDILENEMTDYMSEIEDRTERKAEAMTLYAEFSVDFAVQAMNHALRSALKAIDAQMDCDEKMSTRGDGTPEPCRRVVSSNL